MVSRVCFPATMLSTRGNSRVQAKEANSIPHLNVRSPSEMDKSAKKSRTNTSLGWSSGTFAGTLPRNEGILLASCTLHNVSPPLAVGSTHSLTRSSSGAAKTPALAVLLGPASSGKKVRGLRGSQLNTRPPHLVNLPKHSSLKSSRGRHPLLTLIKTS